MSRSAIIIVLFTCISWQAYAIEVVDGDIIRANNQSNSATPAVPAPAATATPVVAAPAATPAAATPVSGNQVEMVLLPRLFTNKGEVLPVADGATIPAGSYVRVVVIIFGAKEGDVSLVRECKSKTKSTGKKQIKISEDHQVSTMSNDVGDSGVFESWRQIEPSPGGSCTLIVEFVDQKKTFTVKQ